MKRISIDNGHTFWPIYSEEDVDEIFWSIRDGRNISYGTMWLEIVNAMDDAARGKAHDVTSGRACTEEEFLLKYLEFADEDLII